MTSAPVRFQNRTSRGAWGFSGVLLAVIAAMTVLYVGKGPPPGDLTAHAAGVVIVVAWIFALGAVVSAAGTPLATVTIDARVVTLTHRYFRRTETRRFTADQLAHAETVVTRGEDSEYYIARAIAADGTRLDLHEGHDRADCDVACERFNAVVFGREERGVLRAH